jgi:hypothetical protein
MTRLQTIGFSKKVLAAVGAQTVALIVNFIASGEFDRVEVAQVVGLGLTAALGYVAPANPVVER